jgi:hypothetical protein
MCPSQYNRVIILSLLAIGMQVTGMQSHGNEEKEKIEAEFSKEFQRLADRLRERAGFSFIEDSIAKIKAIASRGALTNDIYRREIIAHQRCQLLGIAEATIENVKSAISIEISAHGGEFIWDSKDVHSLPQHLERAYINKNYMYYHFGNGITK